MAETHLFRAEPDRSAMPTRQRPARRGGESVSPAPNVSKRIRLKRSIVTKWPFCVVYVNHPVEGRNALGYRAMYHICRDLIDDNDG